MSSVQKDFYRTLGVHESAEFAVIKAAYKALLMIYHPDRRMGEKDKAVKKTKDINEAYAVLIDPDKRKKYDTDRLGKSAKYSAVSGHNPHVSHELKRALQESEAVLNILDEMGNTFSQFTDLHGYQVLLKESEAILNILNEPNEND